MSSQSASLADVCDIHIGRTPARANRAYWGPGMPWLSIADMNGARVIRTTSEQITPLAVREAGGYLVPPGTVLLSFKLSVGKVAIAGIPMFTNEAIAALSIRDTSRLDPAYLARAVGALDLAAGANRAAMGATLNKAKLAAIRIPLPPLDEQRRIARMLDVAADLAARQAVVLSTTLSLLEAGFLETFGDPARNTRGWSWSTIGEVAQVITGNTPPRSDPGNYGGHLGWVKNDDVRDDRLYVTPPAESLSEIGASRGRSAPAGSVLVTCISGSPSAIGRAALTQARLAFNQQINAVVPEDVDARFLCAQIRLLRPVLRMASTGGMKGLISKSSLQQVPVIVPPQLKQQEFGRLFDAVASQIARCDRRDGQLSHLVAGLQHGAIPRTF